VSERDSPMVPSVVTPGSSFRALYRRGICMPTRKAVGMAPGTRRRLRAWPRPIGTHRRPRAGPKRSLVWTLVSDRR